MRIGNCFSLILLFCSAASFAQNKQVLYDFTDIPQALMVNPGMETDFQWFAGVPFVSGISGHAGSNGVSLNDIFAADGLDINDKVRERLVGALTTRDEFSATARIELFNGGFRSAFSNIFYSFGAYVELDNITYWPQDYAFLAFEGNAGQLNRSFDLGDLKTRGSMVAVYHFGANKKMNKNLTLGARAKVYSGIADYNSTNNSGLLVNTEGENNILSTTIDADLKLRTSGVQALDDAVEDDALPGTLLKRGLLGGDLGLGLDLGFTYRLGDRTVLTGSLLDVGLMYHSGDIESYSLNGSASAEGIEINVLEELADLNRDFWQHLVDEIEESLPFETTNSGYVTFRPIRLNASVRHDFGKTIGPEKDCDCRVSKVNQRPPKYTNAIGAHLFAIQRPRGPQPALTGFYQRRFGHFLALKATYTIDRFSASNVGLGINVQAGPVNLYVIGDNLLSYQNIAASNYASFQLGLNIISWGRKR